MNRHGKSVDDHSGHIGRWWGLANRDSAPCRLVSEVPSWHPQLCERRRLAVSSTALLPQAHMAIQPSPVDLPTTNQSPTASANLRAGAFRASTPATSRTARIGRGQ